MAQKKHPLVRVEMNKWLFMKISIETVLSHLKDELEKIINLFKPFPFKKGHLLIALVVLKTLVIHRLIYWSSWNNFKILPTLKLKSMG